MATWPSTLPQNFHAQGFSLESPNGSLRTDINTNFPNQRKRYTATADNVKGRMWLSRQQYASLINFWSNDLGSGVLSFDWVHPIEKTPCSMRFIANEPPKVVSVSGDIYQVSLSMEIMP